MNVKNSSTHDQSKLQAVCIRSITISCNHSRVWLRHHPRHPPHPRRHQPRHRDDRGHPDHPHRPVPPASPAHPHQRRQALPLPRPRPHPRQPRHGPPPTTPHRNRARRVSPGLAMAGASGRTPPCPDPRDAGTPASGRPAGADPRGADPNPSLEPPKERSLRPRGGSCSQATMSKLARSSGMVRSRSAAEPIRTSRSPVPWCPILDTSRVNPASRGTDFGSSTPAGLRRFA